MHFPTTSLALLSAATLASALAVDGGAAVERRAALTPAQKSAAAVASKASSASKAAASKSSSLSKAAASKSAAAAKASLAAASKSLAANKLSKASASKASASRASSKTTTTSTLSKTTITTSVKVSATTTTSKTSVAAPSTSAKPGDAIVLPATAAANNPSNGQCYKFPVAESYGSSIIPDTFVQVEGTLATGASACAATCNPFFYTDLRFVGVKVDPPYQDYTGSTQPASLECACLSGQTVGTIGGTPVYGAEAANCNADAPYSDTYAYFNVFNVPASSALQTYLTGTEANNDPSATQLSYQYDCYPLAGITTTLYDKHASVGQVSVRDSNACNKYCSDGPGHPNYHFWGVYQAAAETEATCYCFGAQYETQLGRPINNRYGCNGIMGTGYGGDDGKGKVTHVTMFNVYSY